MTAPLVPPAGQRSLGRSLRLDDGDLVFDDYTGTLAEVEQLAALSQALQLSIATQLGTDRLNAQFGFDRLAVGAYAYGLQARKEYVKLQLVRCVGLDTRVRDVRDVFFSDDPRAFESQPGVDAEAQERIAAAIRASREYTVFVFVETVTSQPLTVEAEGNQNPVLSVAFAPDGQSIAAGGEDGTVTVWGMSSGMSATLEGHQKGVHSVGFSPDGKQIVSAGADGTLRLWPAPQNLADALCNKLTTNMSRKQWSEWVSPAVDYIALCPGLPIAPDS